MRLIKLTDDQIDAISSKWSSLPDEIKEINKYAYFNMVDNRATTNQRYNYFLSLIKKYNPTEDNIQYVEYPSFNYIDKVYSMNKPDKFIGSLISQAKSKGKLTKQQDYYLKYYLKNGETPYDAKLLPNNI